MQSPQGMPYGSLPRSLAEQQALQKAQAPPVNLAPFSIQRSMSGKQDKGAHAAAERMQKARHLRASRHLLAAEPVLSGLTDFFRQCLARRSDASKCVGVSANIQQ